MTPLTYPSIPVGVTIAIMGRGLRFAAAAVGRDETFWQATVPEPPMDRPRSQAELAALYQDGYEPMAALIAATPSDSIWRAPVMDRRPVELGGSAGSRSSATQYTR
jgi:hypothetical protein